MLLNVESDPVRNAGIHSKPGSHSDLEPHSTTNQSVARWNAKTHSHESTIEENPDPDDDIAPFKRVVQQFETEPKTSPPVDILNIDIATRLGKITSPYCLRAIYSYDPLRNRPYPGPQVLPFNYGDIFVMHTVVPSGWVDCSFLASADRAWLPGTYCEEYKPEKMTRLLTAVLDFWAQVRRTDLDSEALADGKLLKEINDGVQYLLVC